MVHSSVKKVADANDINRVETDDVGDREIGTIGSTFLVLH